MGWPNLADLLLGSDHETPIGLVDTISGSTRLRVDLSGRADHSGGTPMDFRADALAAAAEVVLSAEALARDPRNRGARLTVGRLDVPSPAPLKNRLGTSAA